jgi:mevalonate kinase
MTHPAALPTLRLPATGRAPAKLILSGEHSVVYGFPALAIAVDRWTTVQLRVADHATAPTQVVSPAIPPSAQLTAALTEVVAPTGLVVDTHSQIPIGRGMGSSASLAVATSRAWCSARNIVPTDALVNQHAFCIERVFHGTPSGVDHGVILRGGAVRFEKSEAGPKLSAVDHPELPLVVIDTGVAGSTKDLVAGVRARALQLKRTLAAMGQLTEHVLQAVADHAPLPHLGKLLTENHRLLGEIGVSTPELDALVDFALRNGALGAKLSGAGGGGVVLALVAEPEPFLSAARTAGLTAFSVGIVPPTGSLA